MEHSFDVDIATEYGIEEAIIFKNIAWWVQKNEANNQNYFDGHYWTFNSAKAFSQLFPYMKVEQIKYALKHLLKENMIIKGEYNNSKFNRTSWWSLGEKGIQLLKSPTQEGEIPHSRGENSTLESQKFHSVLTDINTNINSDIKKESKKESTKAELEDDNPFFDTPYMQVENETTKKQTSKKQTTKKQNNETYNQVIDRLVEDEELNNTLKEWVKSRLFKKDKFTNKAVELAIKRVMKMPIEKRVISVEDAILNGWKGIFEHKERYETQQKTNSQKSDEAFESFKYKLEHGIPLDIPFDTPQQTESTDFNLDDIPEGFRAEFEDVKGIESKGAYDDG